MIENKMTLIPTEDTMIPVQTMIEETMLEAGVSMKILMKVNIVVDEIYSNVIRYSEATKAEIVCRIDGGKIELSFIDNGIPYNPLETEEPDITLAPEKRELGGLGIFIYKRIMDTVEYSYEDGRNKLYLTKEV